MLRARANGETFVSATMCPQQCVLVCQGLYVALCCLMLPYVALCYIVVFFLETRLQTAYGCTSTFFLKFALFGTTLSL